MTNLKIYILDGFPVLGEMGDKTSIEKIVACDICKRKEVVEHTLSYKFDVWNGEDVIKGAVFHLISSRLKEALEKEGFQNISFKKVLNEKSESFKMGKKAYQKKLPDFYKIEIYGKADGPEIWYERSNVCEKCEDQKWFPTTIGISSLIFFDEHEEYTSREVYAKDWKGDDIFLLLDYGPPIITERFLDIINQYPENETQLKEAKWV